MMREIEEPISFRKEIEPMTRAEWVEKAREECEKELEYYEDIRMQADFCRYVDLSENGDEDPYENQREDIIEENEVSIEPESEPVEEEDTWENQKVYQPDFDFSYLSKFQVRLVAAVLIAVLVIAIDYFKVKVNVVDSDMIRTVIQKNDGIESVEDTVTTFARDKVLPIFQKD